VGKAPKIEKSILWASVLGVVLALGILAWADSSRTASTRKLIASIDEPICFVGGSTSNHDGSYEFKFEDSSNKTWTLYLNDPHRDVELARGETRTQLKISSNEERTIIQILDHWCDSDPDANELRLRVCPISGTTGVLAA
jgi:hypothetical protein